jgi:anti-anti-sigma factor
MVDIEVVQRSDGDVHVRVAGEVDISSRRPLAEALRRAVDDQDGAVVIDLSAVRFFSAAGVDCVDAAVTELGARGRPVRVVCPDPGPVWRLICVLRLQQYWPVHHRVADAVASLDLPAQPGPHCR